MMEILGNVSPRLLQRRMAHQEPVGIKSGDISIINQVGSNTTKQGTHLQEVKDDMHLLARFYNDSTKGFRYGVLCMDNCRISLSTSDLTTIEVARQKDDNSAPAPGMLLKAKSREEAMEWVEALSPTAKKTFSTSTDSDSEVN